MRTPGLLDVLLPALALLSALAGWEAAVRYFAIPHFILPAPSAVAAALYGNAPMLLTSLAVTLSITFEALAAAVIGGVGLAIVFARWRMVEQALFPFAVILLVTPIVAIAPLLLIYLSTGAAVLTCAFLVAFFPILANTALGLRSADHNLLDLFQLCGASRWKQLWLLRLPSALPHFLGGLRIAGGLALIGAIVAEIAAGTAGQGAGLAFRIVEAGFRQRIPVMFAALFLISAAGVLIYAALAGLSHVFLRRWHDSARDRGG